MNSSGAYVASAATTSVPFDFRADGTSATTAGLDAFPADADDVPLGLVLDDAAALDVVLLLLLLLLPQPTTTSAQSTDAAATNRLRIRLLLRGNPRNQQDMQEMDSSSYR